MDLLNHLSIKGLKSIREADLTLDAVNVLIGANGSGKSNFVSFFKMLNFMMSGALQEYVGRANANDMLYYGSKQTTRMTFQLDFDTDKGTNTYAFELAHARNTLIFTDEYVSFSQRGLKTIAPKTSLGVGHKEAALLSKAEEKSESIPVKTCRFAKYTITRWRVFQFHDTSDTSPMKQSHYLNDCYYLRDNAGNLAPYLYMLKKECPSHYRKIIRIIQKVFPFFGDFVLEPSPMNQKNINLDWREKGSDLIFGPHQLSDGSLRFIALATLLLQPKERLPSLIIIDEPELGLHPAAINLLASMVRSISKTHQVILATQASRLVDQFEAKDIVIVERKPDDKRFYSEFKRVAHTTELNEWLEDYSPGELWEKNVLGGRP